MVAEQLRRGRLGIGPPQTLKVIAQLPILLMNYSDRAITEMH